MQSASIIFGSHRVSLDVLTKGVEFCQYVDTATAYGNLSDVGTALSKVNWKTKVIAKFNSDDLVNFDESVNKLINDLGKEPEIVLLHSPVTDNLTALRTFQKKFPQALIGVSNFDIAGLENLIRNGFKPSIISLEFSPYYQPRKLIDYCKSHDILITGYRCLAKGMACKDPVILQLARKYRASVASILLSWSNDMGVVPIYSTNNLDHVEVSQVALNPEDIESINGLDKGSSGATCMLKYCKHNE